MPIQWFTYKPDIGIYTPYIPPPKPAHEQEALATYLDLFINIAAVEYKTGLILQIDTRSLVNNYRRYVCGLFWRLFIDKRCQVWEIPRHYSRKFKKLVNLQALLMGQVWRIIRLMPQSVKPPTYVFLAILIEGELLFPDCVATEPQEKITATKLIRKQQGINKELQTLGNPFNRDISPETWAFVENCRYAATRNHDSQKDYTQLVEARMKTVTAIRESLPKVRDQFGNAKVNRGRKSIPSSRSRSG